MSLRDATNMSINHDACATLAKKHLITRKDALESKLKKRPFLTPSVPERWHVTSNLNTKLTEPTMQNKTAFPIAP